MKNEAFIDSQIAVLIQQVPALMMDYQDPQPFLRELAVRASVILASANLCGDETYVYAEQAIGRMLLGFGTAGIQLLGPT